MNWKVIEKTGKPGALIRVVGVGGCGGNAVDHMVKSGLEGVETLAINTDSQALEKSKADVKHMLGELTNSGQGAGAKPEHTKSNKHPTKAARPNGQSRRRRETAERGGGAGAKHEHPKSKKFATKAARSNGQSGFHVVFPLFFCFHVFFSFSPFFFVSASLHRVAS